MGWGIFGGGEDSSSSSSSTTSNVTTTKNIGASEGSLVVMDGGSVEVLDAGVIGRAFDFAEKNTDYLNRSTEEVLNFARSSQEGAYDFSNRSADAAYDFAREAQAVSAANVESIATKNAVIAGNVTTSDAKSAMQYAFYAFLGIAAVMGAAIVVKRGVHA